MLEIGKFLWHPRHELRSFAMTVCRMDAAFERTRMYLQRVIAKERNSYLSTLAGQQ